MSDSDPYKSTIASLETNVQAFKELDGILQAQYNALLHCIDC